MRDISGRTVFITGGAQGIGLGMARAFVEAGANVALADLDEARVSAAAAELNDLTGRPEAAAGYRLDVRDRAAYGRVIDEVEQRFGPIEVLCNNAGLGTLAKAGDLSWDNWDLVLGVNLGGVVNGVQLVLPRMIARGGPGHIVNTASGAGLIASPNLTYATSKFAVVGLSESLRQQPELTENGIGVTVLCPGFVATDVIRNSARIEGREDDPRVAVAETLLKERGLSPDEVGRQVLDAVRSGELYVITDRYIAPVLEQRFQLIFDALPSETERDRELAPDIKTRLATLVPPLVGADR
ncbi:SDR family oxidoreductase [Microlunatus parietis]|uniref:NAD(P)-dependent dehydrogenase (Short-subunit alcohol dehydrogenase family) n=1 Tax=Microlunatus parietis TaxID=682979 RepID=A0A7Y9I944_9ACTN|nr:SDR family NAD(P)-dependent oxidoreductase [Microlunatus parietis]NYE72293.1 NAD(P)-dependent dehydrogenase (short-subunit alcohol dehydrogenase family) [Microlunatus parietis]